MQKHSEGRLGMAVGPAINDKVCGYKARGCFNPTKLYSRSPKLLASHDACSENTELAATYINQNDYMVLALCNTNQYAWVHHRCLRIPDV